MLQAGSGLAPGVEDTIVDDAVGVATIVFTTGVGVGVAGGVAGWVHPAARARTAQSTRADAIISVLFIPDNYNWRVFDDCVILSAGSVPLKNVGKTRFLR